MKYCDDVRCPNFHGGDIDGVDCQLGFKIILSLPHSMADCYNGNWGYKMPKLCQNKFYGKKQQQELTYER